MFPKIGVPQNGWLKNWKTLLKWDDLVDFPIIFGGTPIYQFFRFLWSHSSTQIDTEICASGPWLCAFGTPWFGNPSASLDTCHFLSGLRVVTFSLRFHGNSCKNSDWSQNLKIFHFPVWEHLFGKHLWNDIFEMTSFWVIFEWISPAEKNHSPAPKSLLNTHGGLVVVGVEIQHHAMKECYNI